MGKRKTFPSRTLRRLTSCQKRRRMLTSSCWLLTGSFDWSWEDTDGSVSHSLIGHKECGEVSTESSQCQVSGRGLNESEHLTGGEEEGRTGERRGKAEKKKMLKGWNPWLMAQPWFCCIIFCLILPFFSKSLKLHFPTALLWIHLNDKLPDNIRKKPCFFFVK